MSGPNFPPIIHRTADDIAETFAVEHGTYELEQIRTLHAEKEAD